MTIKKIAKIIEKIAWAIIFIVVVILLFIK